ncbi:MAG: BCCT family transporter, partial [Halapricum sp.]
LFFGGAEPTAHLGAGGGSFFDVAPNTPEAGQAATALTMFHWGLHPWGIYGIVGLALAFFAYNRDLPLSFRSVFYPLVGERVHGITGRSIDIAAVVATIAGLATATGLAALQVNAGLDFIATRYFGRTLTTDVWSTTAIIAVLIGVTVVSAWLGLRKGIKRLSKLNVGLMVSLLVLLVIIGPTVHLFDVLLDGLGTYLGNVVELSLYTEAFAGSEAGWQHAYTIFYWGFWIVWSPFVGLFIARISRGRTIRQFVGGVLLVPVLFSVVWMAVFNGSALFVELSIKQGGISGPLQEHGQAVALFEMFSFYRLALLTAAIATLNLITFFVTSADSGSLVASYLATGGKREASTAQRTLWPIVIGVSAVVLLFGNGLNALKTAVIAAGLPFSVVILIMVYTLYVGLKRDANSQRKPDTDDVSG